MGRTSIKNNLGDSHMSENWRSPYPENKRLERQWKRWKRREAMNVGLKQNCFTSATWTTVKICGNKTANKNDHMIRDEIDEDYISFLDTLISDICSDNDEMDEDYKSFLDAYVSDIDSASDNNVSGSNIDVNTGYSINDDDCDPDYSYFMREQHDHIWYEGEGEGEEGRLHNKLKLDTKMSKDLNMEYDGVDEDYELFLNSGRIDGDSLTNTDNGLTDESSSDRQNSQVSDQAFDTPEVECVFDEDYQVFLNSASNLQDMSSEKITTKISKEKNGSKTSKAFDTHEVQCDIDEDYRVFLKSVSDLVYRPNNNTTKTSKEEGRSNSSDSDQVFLNSASNLQDMSSEKITTKTSKEKNGSKTSKAFDTHEVQCDIDEDYRVFLKSVSDLVYRPNNNTTKTSKEEGRSNSSDSDQVFLNSASNLSYMSDKITTKTSKEKNGSNTSKAFDTREMQCDIDEDYQVFLKSFGDLVYSSDKNTTKTSKVEDGSNSSDSDLIILEPNPTCENTPFVSSKTYDSSCYEKEGNPRDGRQLYADDHSEFRKRLMEYLDRPYDQQEYVVFLQEVNQQKQKERHVETRQRVVKSYHTKGVNKSYLELYPDLFKAITELKEEQPKVLFLLRGFFFWLQNLSHDGVFRPWDDESCLETLRKL